MSYFVFQINVVHCRFYLKLAINWSIDANCCFTQICILDILSQLFYQIYYATLKLCICDSGPDTEKFAHPVILSYLIV